MTLYEISRELQELAEFLTDIGGDVTNDADNAIDTFCNKL